MKIELKNLLSEVGLYLEVSSYLQKKRNIKGILYSNWYKCIIYKYIYALCKVVLDFCVKYGWFSIKKR